MAPALRITLALFACLVLCLGSLTVGAALAQQSVVAQAVPPLEPPRDELGNRRNLAPTGQTVPHLGEPQTGAESAQERGAQKRSDQDTHSICSNCE